MIIKIKFKFVGFINNIIIKTQFYIIKSEINLREFIKLKDLLNKIKDLQIINVNLLIIENFFNYLNYYSFIFKVIIILTDKNKLIDIRITFNIKAEVSYISFNIVLKFEILITYNNKITL